MTPSNYIKTKHHNIQGLQIVLDDYVKRTKPLIDLLRVSKSISFDDLSAINNYELEVRIAKECIEQWKERK